MTVDSSAGTGGLAVRYDERFHVEVEAGAGTSPLARSSGDCGRSGPDPSTAACSTCTSTRCKPEGATGFVSTSDIFHLAATIDGERVDLGQIDGRFLSSETTESFTGRVIGLYAVTGDVSFQRWIAEGDDE